MHTLRLIPRVLGWAVVRGDGETVHRAFGPGARTRCLAWVARFGTLA